MAKTVRLIKKNIYIIHLHSHNYTFVVTCPRHTYFNVVITLLLIIKLNTRMVLEIYAILPLQNIKSSSYTTM